MLFGGIVSRRNPRAPTRHRFPCRRRCVLSAELLHLSFAVHLGSMGWLFVNQQRREFLAHSIDVRFERDFWHRCHRWFVEARRPYKTLKIIGFFGSMAVKRGDAAIALNAVAISLAFVNVVMVLP